MSDKEAYRDKMNAQLDEWNADVDKMRAKADQADADTRIAHHKEIDGWVSSRDAAKTKLKEIDNGADDAWEDVKNGVENSWNDLKHGFNKLTNRFHQ